MKKYVVTGASGLIGQALVPKLNEIPETDVAVVGRDTNKLKELFPTLKCFDYANSLSVFKNSDVVIHLAVANNSEGIRPEYFYSINVDLLESVLTECCEQGVNKFIYTGSTHTSSNRTDAYTESKRAAEVLVNSFSERLPVAVLKIPAVFSENSKGKQKILNRLPKFLQYPAVKLLGLLVPVKFLDDVCDMIITETLLDTTKV